MSRNRFGVLWVALVASAAFAACSSQSSPPVPATTGPSFPNEGSTYSYAGSEWGMLWTAGTAAPQPIPTATWTRDEVVKTGASFGERRQLIDLDYSELETSGSTKGNEYLAWDPIATGRQLEKVGDAYVAKRNHKNVSSTTSVRTDYSEPLVELQWPFASGNSWNGGSAYRAVSTGTVVCNGKRVTTEGETQWNLDGSYDRTTTLVFCAVIGPAAHASQPAPPISLTEVKSDGSVRVTSTKNGVTTLVETIGVPRQNAGGSYVIPFASYFPSPQTTTIPDWYPGGGPPPSPLVRATVTDRGMTALPASCNVPSSLPRSGEAIVRTASQFDPLGTIAKRTETSYYAAGVGLLCDTIVDESDVYEVTAPAAKLAGHSVIRMTVSLTAATLQAVRARVRSFGEPSSASAYVTSASIEQRVDAMRDTLRNRLLQKETSSP